MWLAVAVTFVREGVTCWRGMLAAADNALIVTLGIPHGTSARSETILELATQVLLAQLCTPLVSHCIGIYSLGKREEKLTHESLPISPQKHRSSLHEGLAFCSKSCQAFERESPIKEPVFATEVWMPPTAPVPRFHTFRVSKTHRTLLCINTLGMSAKGKYTQLTWLYAQEMVKVTIQLINLM